MPPIEGVKVLFIVQPSLPESQSVVYYSFHIRIFLFYLLRIFTFSLFQNLNLISVGPVIVSVVSGGLITKFASFFEVIICTFSLPRFML